MILYKKMVRFYSSTREGFKDEIKPITDWIEEDKISEEDRRNKKTTFYKSTTKNRICFC